MEPKKLHVVIQILTAAGCASKTEALLTDTVLLRDVKLKLNKDKYQLSPFGH